MSFGPTQGDSRTDTRTATVLVARATADGEAALPSLLASLAGTGEAAIRADGRLAAAYHSVSAALDAALLVQRRARRSAGGNAPILSVGLSHGDLWGSGESLAGGPLASAEALCDTADPGQTLATDIVRGLAPTGAVFAPAANGNAIWELRAGTPSALPLPEPLRAAERSWDLIDREQELAAISRSLSSVEAGDRALVLLAGEPGIGKTRLAAEAALAAHDRGATVLYGGSQEGAGLPYQAFAEALAHYVQHASEAALGTLGAEAAELTRLVPEIRRRLAPAPPAAPVQAFEDDRYLLFSAVAGLVGAASAAAPLVLILEDLHWADHPTVELLRHLLRAPVPQATLVVATYRTTELGPEDGLAGALTDLRRDGRVTHLELEGLEEDHVVSLMQDMCGRALDADELSFARTVGKGTSGNPLFVTEVLRSVVEEGLLDAVPSAVARHGLSALSPPPTVREVILRRVGRLGSRGREVLESASVLGAEFELAVLERMAGVSGAELTEVLDGAERAGLIAAGGRRPGAFRFVHALIADTLYEGLGESGRGRRHRAAAEALEGLWPDRQDAFAEELARHWERALPADPRRALKHARRAGERGLEQRAPHAAEHWYRCCLDLTEQSLPGDEAQRCDILIGFGTAQRQQGEPASRETLLEAARSGRRLGDAQRLIAAALANSRGFVSGSGVVDEERIAVLECALDAAGAGDSSQRALLLATLAAELSFSGDRARRVQLCDDALAIARRLGDSRTLSHVLALRFVPVWMPGTLDERLASCQESVTLADELGDPLLQFRAVHWRGVALVQAARLEEARRDASRQERLAAKLGDPTAIWISAYDRANLAIVAGRLEDAEREAERAFEVANDSGQPDALPFYTSQLTNIRYEQGRLPELQPLIAEVVAENPGIPAFRAVLALAYAQAELLDDAAELLARDSAGGFARLPEDVTWLAGHVIYAHVCAEVEDRESAAVLYQRLLPWADQIVYTGISAWGDVDHALGRLATVLSEHDRARAHLTASTERYERIGAPVWLARVALDSARALLALGEASDRGAAGDLLDRAARDAHRLGAATIERNAAALREHLRAVAVLGPMAATSARSQRATRRQPAGGAAQAGSTMPGAGRAALVRNGQLWVLRSARGELHLRDAKGVRYLAALLARPHTDLHVLELQRTVDGTSAATVDAAPPELSVRSPATDDAGAVLDADAKRAYRQRMEELGAEVEEAERFNDPERAAHGRVELEALQRELAAAVGLGGRDRRAGSAAERARVNVTRALRATIRRIAEADPSLGHHLERSVRTGTACAYDPSPRDAIVWELTG